MKRFVRIFVKITGFLIALVYFKKKVFYENKKSQSKHLKKKTILVSNHTSLMDFCLYLYAFLFKKIRFLMAEVLYNKGKLFGWFLNCLGGIKVDRDSYDFGFIGEAIDTLDKGGIVGIFPEGKLPINGEMSPFKTSCIEIALGSGALIVPVYTDGNYGLFKRAHMIIGEQLDLTQYCQNPHPTKEEISYLNDVLKDKILDLKRQLEEKLAR